MNPNNPLPSDPQVMDGAPMTALRLSTFMRNNTYLPRCRKRVLMDRRMVLRQMRNPGVIINTAAIQAFFDREQDRQLPDGD